MPQPVDLAAVLQERWNALTEEEQRELLEISDMVNGDGEVPDPDDLDDDEADDATGDESDEADGEEPPVPNSDLSGGQPSALDLARDAQLSDQGAQIAALQQQLHHEQWQRQRDALQLDGVAPWALDLAAPYLGDRQAAVVDLSGVSDDTKNPVKIIVGLLQGMKGQVDLSGQVRGFGAEPDEALTEKDLIKDWFASNHHQIPQSLQ